MKQVLSILLAIVALAMMFASPVSATESAIVVTGDVHACEDTSGDALTANLVESLAGTVVTNGDMGDGRYDCYTETWGRFMDRTKAVAGNHDYEGPDLLSYFGANMGPTQHPTYYSFWQDGWRFYVLDTNCGFVNCDTQAEWLKRRMTRFPAECVGAFMHHPTHSSVWGGGYEEASRFYSILYRWGADVVVSSHRHGYERFTNMGTDYAFDKTGPREFVVGTGGSDRWSAFLDTPRAGSKALIEKTYGVLRLTLGDGMYGWEFIDTDGVSHDTGSDQCFAATSKLSAQRMRRR